MAEIEQNKVPVRSSSRSLAIAAVALLIVVAIAGIVLAGRSGEAPRGGAAPVAAAPAATPAPAPANGLSSTTPRVAATPTAPSPNEVMFAPGSDKLPGRAGETIARFAEAARKSNNGVRLSTRYLTGENKARDFDLAKARAAAVRHALEAEGITGEKMQTELIEVPPAVLDAKAANRVDLILR